MAEFAYQEPARMALGQKIYQQYCTDNEQGNAVSLLSDAMTVLRQLGPAGLGLWIATDSKKRGFLHHALQENASDLAACLTSDKQDMDTAWAEIENLMQVLRCAKYYAKTQEKDE